jgi:hypothetical protein
MMLNNHIQITKKVWILVLGDYLDIGAWNLGFK